MNAKMESLNGVGHEDGLVDAWWRGVELWYNDGDYLAAMDVWFQAADDAMLALFENSPTANGESLTTSFSVNTELVERVVNMKERHVDEKLARLLLFLAGCALDSGDLGRASRYLDGSLRLCCDILSSNDQHDSIAVRAAHEYSSLFEEDDRYTQPQQMASELFQALFRKSRRAPYLIRAIDSKPFYSFEEQPPWCRVLEDHSAEIQHEFNHLWNTSQHSWHRVGSGHHRYGAGQHDGSVVREGDWSEVVLFAQSGSRPGLAPRTVQLLRDHCMDPVVSLAQAGAGEVIFSVLRPRTRIEQHTASHNVRLTAHLGLKVPKENGCYIRVDGVDRFWQEGKTMVFDDSFEHSVVNDTDEYRAVLLIRFWHPSLSAASRRVEALTEVLALKEEDKMRRHNPPVPSRRSELLRGMGKTLCESCFASGFETIRVDSQSRDFFCVCGCLISD